MKVFSTVYSGDVLYHGQRHGDVKPPTHPKIKNIFLEGKMKL